MKRKSVCVAAALVAGSLWGTIGFFSRIMQGYHFDVYAVNALCYSQAAVMFIITALIKNPRRMKVKIKDLWIFVCAAVSTTLISSAFYYETVQIMSLSLATLLQGTAPFFVMAVSAFVFKERLTAQKILALILCIAGCGLVAGILDESLHVTSKGILFGIISAIGYGLYSIFSKLALERRYPNLIVSLYVVSCSALIMASIAIPMHSFERADLTVKTWLMTLVFSFTTTYLPSYLYLYSLGGIDAGEASILVTMEPIVATLISIFVYHEMLSLYMGLGVVMIILSLILVQRQPGRDRDRV